MTQRHTRFIGVVGASALLLSAAGLWRLWSTPLADTVSISGDERDEAVLRGAHIDKHGTWCADELPGACVKRNGDVHIPAGMSSKTVEAYFTLRQRMRDSSKIVAWSFIPGPDRDARNIVIRPVDGNLTASEVLDRMLEGSEFRWEQSQTKHGAEIVISRIDTEDLK